MDFSQFLPALRVNPGDPLFIGDLFGFILAMPVALFLAFWLSAVKNRAVVVVGAFAGTLIGFLGILGWVDTLIYNTPLPGTNGPVTFFGSVLICSIAGLAAAMILDLIVARMTSRNYRRSAQTAHQ